MRFLASLLAVALAGCAGGSSEQKSPGLLGRALSMANVFDRSPEEQAVRGKANRRGLVLQMELSPEPLKLATTRQLVVTLTLSNDSNKSVQLEFPSSQRIEVILRDDIGKEIERWSEDQAFTQEISYVTINPRERVTYTAKVPTRDLEPGRQYFVEGFLPSFEELKAVRPIQPIK